MILNQLSAAIIKSFIPLLAKTWFWIIGLFNFYRIVNVATMLQILLSCTGACNNCTMWGCGCDYPVIILQAKWYWNGLLLNKPFFNKILVCHFRMIQSIWKMKKVLAILLALSTLSK